MELIQKILDLPVIIQGALGSGLFWAIFELGQLLSRKIGEANTKAIKHNQTALQIALGSLVDDDPDFRRILFQGIVHGTLHYLVKAAVFLVMGLIVADVIPIIGMVGYFTALIYLFRALAYVPHLDRWKNREEMKRKYDELKAQREKA